jgi:hypothetical protein
MGGKECVLLMKRADLTIHWTLCVFACAIAVIPIFAQAPISETPQLLKAIEIDRTYHITETGDGIFVWNPRNVFLIKPGSSSVIHTVPKSQNASSIRDLAAVGPSAYALTAHEILTAADGEKWARMIDVPSTIDPRTLRVASDHIWVGGSTSGGPADLDRVPNNAIDDSGNVMVPSITEAISQRWSTTSVSRRVGTVMQMQLCGSKLLVRTAFEAFVVADGNNGWTPVSAPKTWNGAEEGAPTSLFCIDSGHLWVAYSNGIVLRCQGEKGWIQTGTITENHSGFSKIAFVNDKRGAGLARGKLWLTSDGGETWRQLALKVDVFDFSTNPTNDAIDFITTSALERLRF